MYGASNLIPKKTSINIMHWLGTITNKNFEMLEVNYDFESATELQINHIKHG